MSHQSDGEYPRIVVPSQTGHLHIINLEGVYFRLKMEDDTAPTQFCFADIWGDERKDYWYLKDRKMTILAYENTDFSTRFAIDFEESPSHIFSLEYKNETWIAAVFQESKRIAMYDGKGQLHPAFPLAGETIFALQDGIVYVSEGRFIYQYFLD